MELKINKMGYSRVFSLGNYENEKISVEAEFPDDTETTEVYIELKKVVENAHNLRAQLREYLQAKTIVKNPDIYRGTDVKNASQVIEKFEANYPNLLNVKTMALLSESGDSLTSEEAF